jgi:hypothetical protein
MASESGAPAAEKRVIERLIQAEPYQHLLKHVLHLDYREFGWRLPGLGDQMFVQLAAWCKTPAAKQAARRLKQPRVLPAAKAPLYAFEKWEPIWSAGSYTLRDFGEQDVQGCSRLLIAAINATYSGVKAAVEREYGAGRAGG